MSTVLGTVVGIVVGIVVGTVLDTASVVGLEDVASRTRRSAARFEHIVDIAVGRSWPCLQSMSDLRLVSSNRPLRIPSFNL